MRNLPKLWEYVGVLVGSDEGASEGNAVGAIVGADDGLAVGDRVVGIGVGLSDGACVSVQRSLAGKCFVHAGT